MPKKKRIRQGIFLGFDFGMKRIGVAVGQRITRSATPQTIVRATQGIPDWDMMTHLIETWQPEALIVGIPLNMDATTQPLTESAKQFCKRIQARYELPVYTVDERLTTLEAKARLYAAGQHKALHGKRIDSVAAQIILESWLNQEID